MTNSKYDDDNDTLYVKVVEIILIYIFCSGNKPDRATIISVKVFPNNSDIYMLVTKLSAKAAGMDAIICKTKSVIKLSMDRYIAFDKELAFTRQMRKIINCPRKKSITLWFVRSMLAISTSDMIIISSQRFIFSVLFIYFLHIRTMEMHSNKVDI